MDAWIKNYIEKNIKLIEDSNFDTLFNQVPKAMRRLDLAETLSQAGINYSYDTQSSSITSFLNDLRIPSKSVKLYRGPCKLGNIDIPSESIGVLMPDFRLTIEKEPSYDYTYLQKKYKISHIVEQSKYNPNDPGRKRFLPIILFDK